jgi:hypothetical protein
MGRGKAPPRFADRAASKIPAVALRFLPPGMEPTLGKGRGLSSGSGAETQREVTARRYR